MDRLPLAYKNPPKLCIPPVRYVHYSEFHYYYAYGNTRPEDFLESVKDECNPLILVLGCGDIRSCLYTLWKNFDRFVGHDCFEGVTFNLNDVSAGVLARNILFLYLIMKMPDGVKNPQKMKEWISSVWSIWYCHELLPCHKRIFHDALRTLLRFSESTEHWVESKDNPLHYIVKFQNGYTLQQIRKMWRMWLEFSGTCEWMHGERKGTMFRKIHSRQAFSHSAIIALLGVTYTSGQVDHKLLVNDFDAYIEGGSAYAETVFGLSYDSTNCTVNSSFFEEDNFYSLHYASVPYKCYHFLGSISKKKAGIPAGSLVSDVKSQPLLANCVQQFAIWLSSTASILKSNMNVKFIVDCSDAIAYSLELRNDPENKFDAIFTSNLIDPLSPPAVVFSVTPLLKEDGLIFTTSLLYGYVSPDIEEFIKALFGIPSKGLLQLYGVRCISCGDSDGYKLIPNIDMDDIIQNLVRVGKDCTLMWAKTDVLKPPLLDSLKQNVAEALFNCIKTSTTSFLQCVDDGSGLVSRIALCTQTAVESISCYAKRVGKSGHTQHHSYWDRLCQLLREDNDMRPFLLHLQTQILLHELHLHITLSDGDCPICNNKPIDEFIGQFTVTVDTQSDPNDRHSPFFIIFMHNTDHDILTLPNWVTPIQDDIHVIDSVVCEPEGLAKIKISFFLPLSMINASYSLTISKYDIGKLPFIGSFSCVGGILHKTKVNEIPSHIVRYSANIPSVVKHSTIIFGRVTEFVNKSDHYHTTISLNEAVLHQGLPLKSVPISNSSFEITCGESKMTLHYPSPICTSKVHIKLSRRNKTLSLHVPLGDYHFYNERVLAHRNPDNKLFYPKLTLRNDILQSCIFLQFTHEELNLLKTNSVRIQKSPIENVKDTLSDLFTSQPRYARIMCSHTSNPNTVGLFIIHDLVFDIQNGSPAFDLFYTFNSSGVEEAVFTKWMLRGMKERERHLDITIDDTELPVLMKVLDYFAKQTLDVRHPLGKDSFIQHFKRALVYPLYVKPELRTKSSSISSPTEQAMESILSSSTISPSMKATTKRCSYCNTQHEDLKKCSGCGQVEYCGKECQKKDWPVHKPICLIHKSKTHPVTKCDVVMATCGGCGKNSTSLLKCSRCSTIAYCSKECQRKDWTRHEETCNTKK